MMDGRPTDEGSGHARPRGAHVSGPADRALQEAGIRTLQDLSAIRRRRLPRCTGSARSDGWTEALARHGLEFAGTESDAEEHPS